ncbi:acyl-CoA dehydrogenase [Christensenellaceae bacterium OttesenSCG-928-K19]|nr:acyl-CoA dehydrogenase [Christensenellaceae bacterium OttesenSCG-928-K19]
MDFTLSKEHQMLQKLYQDFAEREVKPLAAELDEEERFPDETLVKLRQNGMMGVSYPKEYGGQGCDMLANVLLIEEIAKVCATTAVILAVHSSLVPSILLKHGSEEQKQKYLTPLMKGDYLGAFAITEANAGTDAAAQQTKADRDGDYYILNGSKLFITNAGKADVYLVLAVTDKTKRSRGISAFVIEKGMEGFTIGPKEKKMGLRGSSTCEIIFENCKVPKENRIGAEGKGYSIALGALDIGRIGIAAQALGIAEGAFDETVQYVKERKQFGKPLAAFQNTQFTLAAMKAKIDAAKLLVYRAALAKDNQKVFSLEAATAKLFASETAMEVTTQFLQLFGGYGYMRDYPIERMMRDAKITQIYEGTSEVQKMVISSTVLK